MALPRPIDPPSRLPARALAPLLLLASAGAGAAAAHDVAVPEPAAPAAPAAMLAGAAAAASAVAPAHAPATFGSLREEVLAWTPPSDPQSVPQEHPQDADQPGWPVQTWTLPAIEVIGEPLPALREEELIGPYKQPRWTAHRRFATVRSYVIPEGAVDVEYWARIDDPKKGDTKIRNLYEVEIGLPHRFQLDLYAKAQNEGNWVPFDMTGQMVELRYALANWGEIWGNPTLYLEWINNYQDPDAWEGKLLLSDQAAPGWHWATNFSMEQQTTGDQERELQFTFGLSKTIVDEVFSAGAEFKAQTINTKDDRSEHDQEFFLGPSFQYRPSHRTHIDFVPLLGIGGESPNAQVFFIFGFEF